MTLSKVEKDWIVLEIKDKVQAAMAEYQKDNVDGRGRVIKVLKDWGVGIGLFLAVIGWYGSYVEFRTNTNDRLNNIESSLRELTASKAPAKVLSELASLDVKQFTKNLQALTTVTEQPPANVIVPAQVLQSVGSRLLALNDKTENYWPTVLKFVQFASEKYSDQAPPPGTPVQIILGSNKSDTSIHLGSHRVILLNGGRLENETFVGSRIIFGRNPLVLVNVHFINCAFEFQDANEPSPLSEQVGRQLLASGIKDAAVTGM